mmetsp:Transcript_23832/g.40776  ORF Transcript_23832/g.40776 Transcript_23832/m.40776 type:complete len:163 (+) Transcript_23832:52-540(+)
MPTKTVHGWSSRGQIKRQSKHAGDTRGRLARTCSLQELLRQSPLTFASSCRAHAAKAWLKARDHLMEQMGEAANDDKLLEKRATEIFDKIDTDDSGRIDEEELKEAMAKAGVNLTHRELVHMIEEADEDGDGQIDAREFTNLMRAQINMYKLRAQANVCLLM